jgi:RNA polymerase sigma-70 factor (ECF subfamily)
MTLLARADLPEEFAPFRALRERLGFVPEIFPAQSLLPRAIEAQAAIIQAFLLAPGALSWIRREEILVAISAAHRNRYCVAVHAHILRSHGCPDADIEAIAGGTYGSSFEPARAALLDFGVRLSLAPWAVGGLDFERLRALSLADAEILEAIQTSALTRFLCTLSTGLAVEPEFELPPNVRRAMERAPSGPPPVPSARPDGPPVKSIPLAPETFPPFAFLKKAFGFVPRLYRAQTLRPETLEAEALAIRDVLLTEDVLTRRQKEFLLLAVSAANLNTYHVAVHGEILRSLGVEAQDSDRIAADYRGAGLSASDEGLLGFAVKLATRPGEYGEEDARALRALGFTDTQILEGIVMTALATLLNGLEAGLAPKPDFRPRRDFLAERAEAERAAAVPKIEDPDAPLAVRARGGDTEAFETLIRRHQGLVYRTLVGLTGNAEDAEDGSQAVFVNAFRKIRDFAGAARFSTWLTRIAINEGLERLRRRHPTESLSLDAAEEDASFRPSLIAPWVDDPERVYAREEMRQIVRQELARLPVRYRAAVMLRDIEQLSTSEAAAALEVPVATLKTRLLRGRLLMREALAPYFAGGGPGARPA